MSKSGSSIQYGRSRPNGTSTSRRRNGASWSMRSRMICLVTSSPAPPGAVAGVVDVERRDVAEDRRRLHVEEAGVDPAQLAHGRHCRQPVVEPGMRCSTSPVCTRWPTAATPTCSPTAAGGGATPGWSSGDGASLLVDTLFDLRPHGPHARRDGAHRPRPPPSGPVVNTHANGDHCYGNQLVGGAEIVAVERRGRGDGGGAAGAARRSQRRPTARSATCSARFFGEFHFEGIELRCRPAPSTAASSSTSAVGRSS